MSRDTPDILKQILSRKKEEIEARRQNATLEQVQEKLKQSDIPRGFVAAMQSKVAVGEPAVIAEIKKASPSKGIIRADFDPAQIARSYEKGGAACLSVLTDEDFFQGHDDYLVAARDNCALPVIRKDFIINSYQIYEARALGADCILLIVAALDDNQLKNLFEVSTELGMDTLVEVHDAQELKRALALKLSLVGINNRDLRSFDTSLSTTLDLLGDIPSGCLVVTESGIHTTKDVELMRNHGVNAFLVGEAFMRADEPGEELGRLFYS